MDRSSFGLDEGHPLWSYGMRFQPKEEQFLAIKLANSAFQFYFLERPEVRNPDLPSFIGMVKRKQPLSVIDGSLCQH